MERISPGCAQSKGEEVLPLVAVAVVILLLAPAEVEEQIAGIQAAGVLVGVPAVRAISDHARGKVDHSLIVLL